MFYTMNSMPSLGTLLNAYIKQYHEMLNDFQKKKRCCNHRVLANLGFHSQKCSFTATSLIKMTKSAQQYHIMKPKFSNKWHISPLSKQRWYILMHHSFRILFVHSFTQYFKLSTYHVSSSRILIVINSQEIWRWKLQFRHCGKKWRKWIIMNSQ